MNDNSNSDYDIDLNLSKILKKIIKIINNPIILEYQLVQIIKIDIKSKKYIKYHKILDKINNSPLKFIKSHKYIKKINNILSKNNDTDYIKNTDILTKLICINF